MKPQNYFFGFVIILSLFLAACSNSDSGNNTNQMNNSAETNAPNNTGGANINLGPGTRKPEGCNFEENISCYNYKYQIWPDSKTAFMRFTMLNNLNETTRVKAVSVQRISDCPASGCKTCSEYSNALWDKGQEFLASISAVDCIPPDKSVKSEFRITVNYTTSNNGVDFAHAATGNLVVKPIISSVH